MSWQPSIEPADRPFLYVTEFLHRVNNEYTKAISLATRLAARSSEEETKAALAQIIDQLHALARAHEVLRPPLTTAFADLSANLTQLCQAMVTSGLAQRGIELHLSISKPVLLDAKRCWRAQLIVSELITNASRHAFVSQAGRISVAVKTASGQVICRVSDDGSPATTLKPGLGTELIAALAADLDGYVERLQKTSGTTTTLRFPQIVPSAERCAAAHIERTCACANRERFRKANQESKSGHRFARRTGGETRKPAPSGRKEP
jgi:two-component sensor histidine kinase